MPNMLQQSANGVMAQEKTETRKAVYVPSVVVKVVSLSYNRPNLAQSVAAPEPIKTPILAPLTRPMHATNVADLAGRILGQVNKTLSKPARFV